MNKLLLGVVAVFARLTNARLVGVFVPIMAATGLIAADTANYFQAPGTKAMAQRLEKIAREINPGNSRFFSAERVEVFGPQVGAIQDPERLRQVLPGFALDLLNAGRTEEAIEVFAKVERLAQQSGASVGARNKMLLHTYQAVAQLRLGEQQNCLTNHTIDSCLLPIRGSGVHLDQRGSRGAIKILEQALQEFPTDLRLRWLLNIASMTVGEYPDKVPPKWLIPPRVFESDYDIKRFADVAAVAGVDVKERSGGSVVEDFDGDGLLDIMVSSIGLHDLHHDHH